MQAEQSRYSAAGVRRDQSAEVRHSKASQMHKQAAASLAQDDPSAGLHGYTPRQLAAMHGRLAAASSVKAHKKLHEEAADAWSSHIPILGHSAHSKHSAATRRFNTVADFVKAVQ
jgi:hypothetical protein